MASSSSKTTQNTTSGSKTTSGGTSNTVSQGASTSQTAGTSSTYGGSSSVTNSSTTGGSHSITHTSGGSTSDTTSKGGSNSQTAGKSWASGAVDSDIQAYKKYYESGYNQSQQVTDTYNRLQDTLNNKPSAFSSSYTDKLNNLYDQIMNRGKFSYNFNADPMYRMYRDQYIQQGRQAMQDTMGQAAALTGGYGSSYSQTAGQQTYQNYLTQLNNMIPELRDQAYEEWRAEGEDLNNKYDLTQNAYNNEYNQYRDTVSDWQADRSFDLSNYQSDRDFDYSRFTGDRSYYQNEYWNQRNAEQSNASNTDSTNWSQSHTNESNWSTSETNATNWSNTTSTTNSTNWSNTASNSVTATNNVNNSTTNDSSWSNTNSWSNSNSSTTGWSSDSGSNSGSTSSYNSSANYDRYVENSVSMLSETSKTNKMSEKQFQQYVEGRLKSGAYSENDARAIMLAYDQANGTDLSGVGKSINGDSSILSKSNANWNSYPSTITSDQWSEPTTSANSSKSTSSGSSSKSSGLSSKSSGSTSKATTINFYSAIDAANEKKKKNSLTNW